MRSPLETAIEQRIARGWTVERISADVLCTDEEVLDVADYLDGLIREPVTVPAPIKHGIGGYKRGCPCAVCREANRVRYTRQRQSCA